MTVPPDVEQVLDNLRDILLRWRQDGTCGEVTVVVGQNEYRPLERPTHKHPPVKREGSAVKGIIRVG